MLFLNHFVFQGLTIYAIINLLLLLGCFILLLLLALWLLTRHKNNKELNYYYVALPSYHFTFRGPKFCVITKIIYK
jgi:hypothetical protein